MRNLAQYPLTAEEAHQVLAQHVQTIVDKQAFGGIDAHALTRIGKFLELNDAAFRNFLKQTS